MSFFYRTGCDFSCSTCLYDSRSSCISCPLGFHLAGGVAPGFCVADGVPLLDATPSAAPSLQPDTGASAQGVNGGNGSGSTNGVLRGSNEHNSESGSNSAVVIGGTIAAGVAVVVAAALIVMRMRSSQAVAPMRSVSSGQRKVTIAGVMLSDMGHLPTTANEDVDVNDVVSEADVSDVVLDMNAALAPRERPANALFIAGVGIPRVIIDELAELRQGAVAGAAPDAAVTTRPTPKRALDLQASQADECLPSYVPVTKGTHDGAASSFEI